MDPLHSFPAYSESDYCGAAQSASKWSTELKEQTESQLFDKNPKIVDLFNVQCFIFMFG